MTTSVPEKQIADRIRAAYVDGPIDPFATALGVGDIARAYRVQEINTEVWLGEGRRLVGRKIGLTSPAVQKQLGVDQPDYGMLFADMLVANGATIDGRRLLQPRVEAEIAFVLKSSLEASSINARGLIDCIGGVAPAIEIVDSRVRDWRISIVDTIADNASSAFFVLGELRSDPASVDLVNCKMRLSANGKTVSEGRGSDCLGSPLNSTVWLARKMIEVGRPLKAGDIVMSGALGPMVAAQAGSQYRAEIEGLGTATVSF
jgi:2-keto-4-pentenoate hydratase